MNEPFSSSPCPTLLAAERRKEEKEKGRNSARNELTINCSPRYCEMSAEARPGGRFISSNVRETHFKQPLISATFVRYPWLSTDVIETSRVRRVKEIMKRKRKKGRKEKGEKIENRFDLISFLFFWAEMDWNEMKIGEEKLKNRTRFDLICLEKRNESACRAYRVNR